MLKFGLTLVVMALPLLQMTAAVNNVRNYTVEVVNTYPHDTDSYTQGLFFMDGIMYESTGEYGNSTFRKVDMLTGKSLRRLDFSDKYFVEGSVALGKDIYILTWKNKVAFVYDGCTLEYKKTVSYPREGWGLTTDGTNLIASDGSSELYFLDKDLRCQRTITVKLRGRPVRFLNELEYINGKIWANVYTSDIILIINPDTGNAEGVIDCTGLLPSKDRKVDTDVLNGIAWDKSTDRIFLTGKNWPKLFEIRLKESGF